MNIFAFFNRPTKAMRTGRLLATTGVSMLVSGACLITVAWGDCRLERGSDEGSNMMVRRLAGSCTSEERLLSAIPGEEVLQALQAKRGVELESVVLTGDVMLDRLPAEVVTPEDLAIPLVGERLSSGHIQEVRRIRGPLILRHVEVQGLIATNFVTEGYLLVEGPVRILNSTVQRSIDFSRTAFLDSVEFSGSNILHEAFFIQSVFTKGTDFGSVHFGTHSRFHKAVFGAKATFTGSTFRGLAEFLEGTYREEAEFSKVRFTMGTGFSGSRFQQQAIFTQAAFDREAYFRYAEFDGDARFQGVSFGAAADFTEAGFHAAWDFTRATFAVLPQFPKAQVEAMAESGDRLKGVGVQAGLFAFLFIVLLVLIFRSRRSQPEKPTKSS